MWCLPCREEIPNIVRLDREIPDDELRIIGIATRDSMEVLTEYIRDNRIDYPNTLVKDGAPILLDYGITSYPTTLLVDPDGVIRARNLRGQRLVELVREKMSQK